MAKVFVIPFLITLTTLNLLNASTNFEGIIKPAIIITTGIFLILFISKKYTFSIFCISISISLLIGFMFLEKRTAFNTIRSLDICSEQYIKIRGKVLRFPVIGNSESTIILRTDKTSNSGTIKRSGIILKINVSGDLRHLCPGDTIEIDTTIKRPRPPLNFYPSKSESFLLASGIHFSGYSKSALFTERIKKAGFIYHLTQQIREKVRSLIEKKYAKTGGGLEEEGQMLEALLLGDRGRITPELKEILLKTGVYHLFAISGAHIGIIALLIMFLLKTTKIRERGRYLILISVLLLFLVITGFKVSAERAVLMAVLLSIAKIFYLKSNPLNILSFAGLILLIIDPCSFLDPGFNLTFLITAGIISGRNIFFPEENRKNSYLKEAAAANLNAAVCSIPVSLFFFMRYSFTGILSGLILLPITAVIMCFSLPIIPLSLYSFLPAFPFLLLSDISLKIFFFLAGSFSKIIDLSIFRPPPSVILIFLFFISFFFLCYSGRNWYIKTFFALLTVSFLTMTIIRGPQYDPEFPEIYFLDVGQGDSHIVVLPGGDSLLIDGGGSRFGDFEVGKQIVLPFILRKGIRVRWIAVSHYHPDHCRGINEIVGILKPEEVWISSAPENNRIFDILSDKCRGITKLRKIASGFRISKCNVVIEVLYPFDLLIPFSTKNDHSQVIKLTSGDHTVLFTGDIEIAGENALVKKYGRDLKCSILKVPHHGSGTSSSLNLLRMCRPDNAIFPLGYKNSFGFPDREVIKRYKLFKTRLFFTSEHGGIMARLIPGVIKFEVSRFPPQRSVNF